MFRIKIVTLSVFSVFSVVRSDTLLTISGYAFPNGIQTDNSAAMINSLQSTLQSHFDMVPPSLRSQGYIGAKQAFDAAASGASTYAASMNINGIPNITPIRAPNGGLVSSVASNLPSPLKRLMEAVQYFRSMCPLCRMIDRAIGSGNMPMSVYAIDANGQIFIDRGNQLVPSGYSFNGQSIVDSTGATIASITS